MVLRVTVLLLVLGGVVFAETFIPSSRRIKDQEDIIVPTTLSPRPLPFPTTPQSTVDDPDLRPTPAPDDDGFESLRVDSARIVSSRRIPSLSSSNVRQGFSSRKRPVPVLVPRLIESPAPVLVSRRISPLLPISETSPEIVVLEKRKILRPRLFPEVPTARKMPSFPSRKNSAAGTASTEIIIADPDPNFEAHKVPMFSSKSDVSTQRDNPALSILRIRPVPSALLRNRKEPSQLLPTPVMFDPPESKPIVIRRPTIPSPKLTSPILPEPESISHNRTAVVTPKHASLERGAFVFPKRTSLERGTPGLLKRTSLEQVSSLTKRPSPKPASVLTRVSVEQSSIFEPRRTSLESSSPVVPQSSPGLLSVPQRFPESSSSTFPQRQQPKLPSLPERSKAPSFPVFPPRFPESSFPIFPVFPSFPQRFKIPGTSSSPRSQESISSVFPQRSREPMISLKNSRESLSPQRPIFPLRSFTNSSFPRSPVSNITERPTPQSPIKRPSPALTSPILIRRPNPVQSMRINRPETTPSTTSRERVSPRVVPKRIPQTTPFAKSFDASPAPVQSAPETRPGIKFPSLPFKPSRRIITTTTTTTTEQPNNTTTTERSLPQLPQTERTLPKFPQTERSLPRFPQVTTERSLPQFPKTTERSLPQFPQTTERSIPRLPQTTERLLPKFPQSTERPLPRFPTERNLPQLPTERNLPQLPTERDLPQLPQTTERSLPLFPSTTEGPIEELSAKEEAVKTPLHADTSPVFPATNSSIDSANITGDIEDGDSAVRLSSSPMMLIARSRRPLSPVITQEDNTDSDTDSFNPRNRFLDKLKRKKEEKESKLIGKSPCPRGSEGRTCRRQLALESRTCTDGSCEKCRSGCSNLDPSEWPNCCRDHLLCCRHLAAACRTCSHPQLQPFCSAAFNKCS